MKKILESKILPVLNIDSIEIIRNSNKQFGEYSTNVAMKNKLDANEIANKLSNIDIFENVSVAGPGFINFDLKKTFIIEAALKHFDINYSAFEKKAEKINYEFVSANPTGSLHLGHARNAFVGDVVTRILEYIGHNVKREYYLNDNGVQIDNLASSVQHFYDKELGKEAISLEDVSYKGDEIEGYAKKLLAESKDYTLEDIKSKSVELSIEEIKETLSNIGLKSFDEWVSEKELFDNGAVAKAMDKLKASGKTFEEDGATWLRTTDFGDDKDRVLQKSDGTFTYLVGDIANHAKKFDEGFNKLIDLWGTDHHGYVERVKASLDILGYNSKDFEVDFINMVKVLKNGEEIKMSKRAGTGVTIDYMTSLVDSELLRFFILNKTKEQNQTIELEEVTKQDNTNPYWYIQYAYARASQILAKFQEEHKLPTEIEVIDNVSDSELELIKEMIDFEDKLEIAASAREPFVLITYIKELANAFHSFYNSNVVISDDIELMRKRIILLISFRNLMSKAFDLLGIKPKEKM